MQSETNAADPADRPTGSAHPGSSTGFEIRRHTGMAVALITVLPALVTAYAMAALAKWVAAPSLSIILAALFGLLGIILGYALLVRHGRNLVRLRSEMLQHRRQEEALLQHQADLEKAVSARTAELEDANSRLQQEVEDRRRAEALKDDFVSTVSHELRTPLAITKEGVALLLDQIPGTINDKQRRILTTAKGSIDRLARIINDLLDMSRIEAGKMLMNKSRVDLGVLAQSIGGTLEPLARKKGLNLLVTTPGSPLEVYADADRLIQVLTNLIGNAVKFTSEGHIRVEVSDAGNHIACRVEDTGVGLKPEETQRIFEKFVQVGRTHGAGEKGTGLGLAIARKIVQLHHGDIRVESEVGRGSCFTVELPKYDESLVLEEQIDSAIAEAKQAQEELTLLLFRFHPVDSADTAELQAAFRDGFRRLIELQNLARSSDKLYPRGGNQVVMLGRITPAQFAILFRRWQSQVTLCFHESEPGIDVTLWCGYAQYPEDGSTAGDLLNKADQTLSLIGTTQDNGYGESLNHEKAHPDRG